MKRLRIVATALLLTFAFPELGSFAHFDSLGIRASSALASSEKETWSETYFGDDTGTATATVDGLFSYDGVGVQFAGYGNLVGTGGEATGDWTIVTDQGPGYYFNSNPAQITFWINVKFLAGTSYECGYPRAVGYYNGYTDAYDGDQGYGGCSF